MKEVRKIEKSRIKAKFEVLNKADDVTEVYLYGDIVPDDYWYGTDEDVVTSKRVRDTLKGISTSRIDLHINSNGGDVFESIAIHNILKQHQATIHVYVDAIAASGMSVIAMAADKIFMYSNSMMMIHNAWTVAWGNANQLRKVADDLEKINSAVSESYKSKFVGTGEELKALLDEESFLTAEECLALGFCDEIVNEPQETKPKAKESILNKYRKDAGDDESSFFMPQNILSKFKK